MILFFERPATKEELFVPLVDEVRDVRAAAVSIEQNAVKGGRKLKGASNYDEIDIIEVILYNCSFVEKSFAEYLIQNLRDTKLDLYNTIDQYNDLINERREAKG